MDKRIEKIEKITKKILETEKSAEIRENAIQQGQQNQLRDKILDWIFLINFAA